MSSQSSPRSNAFQFNHTQSPSTKSNGSKQHPINVQQPRGGFQNYYSPVGTSSSPSKSNKKDSPNLINQLNSSPVQSHQQFHIQGPHTGSRHVLYRPSSSVTTATIPNPPISGKKGQQHNNASITSQKALMSNGVHKSAVQKGKPNDTIKSHTRIQDAKGSSGVRSDFTIASHQSPPQNSVPTPPAPAAPPEKSFKPGDDVLFNAEDGSMVFGTVGMIHGQTLQILFGDGTQQWAHFKRVKNFSASVPEEEECTESKEKSKQGRFNKTVSSDNDQTSSSEEVTCGSCGTVKRVAGKKALNYHPYTSHQFNCRRCLNKSSFSKNSMIITPANRGRTIQQHSAIKSEHHDRVSGEVNRRSDDECFHCKGKTSYNDRLHCNLCERACHLSCLAISPTPLEGDRFWDVICSACGTQNGDSGSSGTKVFSCRRSISSWSDVAHLVLSCLGTQHAGERYFDLDIHVIPFIDSHMDKLHLPRSYKTKQAEDRKTFLKTALNNAKLRFINSEDSNGKLTLWAIRDNNNHQGYPYRSSIPPRPPNASPPFQSSSSSTVVSNKVPTPQSSPLSMGVGSLSKSRPPGAPASVPVRSQSPSKLSGYAAVPNTADIQSRIMASIPKTILNVKQHRNGTVGSAFCAVGNVASASGSGCLNNNFPTATEEFFTEGSSRTLGKGSPKSPKKIPPPIPSGLTLTVTSRGASEVDPKALDTAVEQSRQGGVKRPNNIAFRNDISISIIRPDEDSTNTTESETERGSTDTDSDSNQNNGVNVLSQNSSRASFGQKRKMSLENSFDVDDDLTKKKQKLALDLPGFRTPVKLSPDGYNDSSPGGQISSVNSSPISEKMSNIFRNLNGATSLISRSFPKPSPTESISAKDILTSKTLSPTSSEKLNNNSGKAVKSASITPPGRNKVIQLKDKPLLRMRKPKALQVLTAKVTKKAKEAAESIGKVAGAGLGKRSTFGLTRGRGRGRPLKGPPISNLNGILVQPPPEAFDDTIKTNEYTVMSATVEDLIKFGKGITMQCLPQQPSNTEDLVHVASKYLLMEEKPSPPSFWSSDESSKCNKWQRSKRDLKNLDSYEITGKMTLPDGTVKYLCSWKDGFGNSEVSSADLSKEPYYEISDDDLFDPSAFQNIVDQMDSDENEQLSSLVSNNNATKTVPTLPKATSLENNSPSKLSGNTSKLKKAVSKLNSAGNNSMDNSSLDKDTFLVSGLGLRKQPRKDNHSQQDKPAHTKFDDIIDLTADSP